MYNIDDIVEFQGIKLRCGNVYEEDEYIEYDFYTDGNGVAFEAVEYLKKTFVDNKTIPKFITILSYFDNDRKREQIRIHVTTYA
jgi:hypothetical protein